MRDIWDFQERLSNRLLLVNIVNIALGLLLSRRQGDLKGVGNQAVGWGVVNIGIAVGGRIAAERRQKNMESPLAPEVQQKETHNLKRILLINSVLDVFYVLSGRWMTRRPNLRGQGIGIMIQGALLFIFDLVHVWQMQKK